jgi:hypothetical protein
VEAGAESASSARTEKSAEEREALLTQAVANEVKRGWSLESQEDFQAVMVRMRRSTYLLHLLLTVFTSPQAPSTGGEVRKIITVDEYGNTEILR